MGQREKRLWNISGGGRVGIEIIAGIAALASTALGIGTTIAAATKGAPELPKVPKPPSPPPSPPPAPELPPPPQAVEAEGAIAEERKRRQQRFGVAQTLLTSPLGTGSQGPGSRGPSLLGGG
jgi:hypothetical protein